MELILINDNKLKIILTGEDLSELGVSCDEMDYDDTGTRKLFWDLFDKAKRQTGFDAAEDRICIQVYPDKNGGCLMYVTKTAVRSAENAPFAGTATYEKKYKSKLYTGIKKKTMIYVFGDSEPLAALCRHLSVMGYGGRSDIYCDESRYYLCIEDNKEITLDVTREYGSLVNSRLFACYLDEHCIRLASGNAVEVFSRVYGSPGS